MPSWRALLFLAALNGLLHGQMQPPHCSSVMVTEGISTAQVSARIYSLDLTASESICFRFNDSNNRLLYTVTIGSVQQEYPIAFKYSFAYPRLNMRCICDCSDDQNICDTVRQYRLCSEKTANELCYENSYEDKAGPGCHVCCTTRISPLYNFTAIKLSKPVTYATVEFSAFDYIRSKWVLVETGKHRLISDHSQRAILDKNEDLLLVVSRRGNLNKLQTEGSDFHYFYNSHEQSILLHNDRLNSFNEWDLHKLGWFQHIPDRGQQFQIRKGQLKIRRAQTVNVVDCQRQKYDISFNGEYFENEGQKMNVPIGRPIENFNSWISQTKINNRDILIEHRLPKIKFNIKLQLRRENSRVHFFQNASEVADFGGSIIVDIRSNRFLNLSLIGVRGRLRGRIRKTEQLMDRYTFSIYVNSASPTNHSQLVALPSHVNGSRYVCLDTFAKFTELDAKPEKTGVCHWVRYDETRLEQPLIDGNPWIGQQTDCAGCNVKKGSFGNLFEKIFNFVNPAGLFSHEVSIEAKITKIVTIAIYVFFLVIIISIVRNCIYPILKIFICPISTISK